MYVSPGPAGDPVSIPQDSSEDQPYFGPGELAAASKYLHEQGYVVLRGLVSREQCAAATQRIPDVARYPGYLYRQTTANPERNVVNERGFIMNPLLNVQDVPTAALAEFRARALDVVTGDGVKGFLREHFGEDGKLVQSMLFQGNTATWAHQDTYYLDAERIGSMTAGWFALEDIRPGAGRFFVYPGSHLIDIAKNGGSFDVAFHHDRYKELIIDIVRRTGLPCVAPALRQGDVLFWNSRTIHGSLATTQPEFSRASFTAHYIPDSAQFLQLQSRLKALKLHAHNGMRIHHPKSLDRASQRLLLWIETRFAGPFQLAKRLAVKALTSRRRLATT
jgi:phytanoyl-CoA hydroxylase